MTKETAKYGSEASRDAEVDAGSLEGVDDATPSLPPTQLASGGRLAARRGPDGRYITDPTWRERVAVAHAADNMSPQNAPDPREELLPLIGSRRAVRHAELIRERAWTAVIRRLAELSAKGAETTSIRTLRATYMAQFNRFPLATWWLSAWADQPNQPNQPNHPAHEEMRGPRVLRTDTGVSEE